MGIAFTVKFRTLMEDAPQPSTVAELLQRPAIVVLQNEAPDQGAICMSSEMIPDDALTLGDLASFTPKQREFYMLVAGFRYRYGVRSWAIARDRLPSKPQDDAVFALTPQLHHNRVAIKDAVEQPMMGLHPSNVIVDVLHEGERWEHEEYARERQALKKALAKQREDAKKKEKPAHERQAEMHRHSSAEKKEWY